MKVVDIYDTNLESGLSSESVNEKRGIYGTNELEVRLFKRKKDIFVPFPCPI